MEPHHQLVVQEVPFIAFHVITKMWVIYEASVRSDRVVPGLVLEVILHYDESILLFPLREDL